MLLEYCFLKIDFKSRDIFFRMTDTTHVSLDKSGNTATLCQLIVEGGRRQEEKSNLFKKLGHI